MRGIYDAVYRPNVPPSGLEPSSPPAPKAGSEAAGVHATILSAVAMAAAAASGIGDPAPKHTREGIEAERGRGDESSGKEAGRGVTPFLPDERLTLEEAVWMYTAGGAVAAGVEDRLGVIRPGSLADLTIIDVEGGAAGLLKHPRSVCVRRILKKREHDALLCLLLRSSELSRVSRPTNKCFPHTWQGCLHPLLISVVV